MGQEKWTVEGCIVEDVREVISGFMAEYRIKGRLAGLTAIRAKIPLKEFRERLRERLVGRRMMDDRGDPVMKALKRARVPSPVELRSRWLPAAFAGSVGIEITEDAVEMTVAVPPPRKAYAR